MKSNPPGKSTKKLPSGWQWAKLGDVCDFRHGGTPSKDVPSYWSGEIPWASPKDMHVSVLGETVDHISFEALSKSAACVVPKGSLLAVVRSGILARHFPLAIAARDISFNQDIKAILPKHSNLDSLYLFYLLLSLEPYILSEGVKKGATVHSVKSGFIEGLPVPIPPLPEQQCIASLLKKQMAAVERARALVLAQIEDAQALTAAYLREAFPQPGDTLPKGWRWLDLAKIATVYPGQHIMAADYNSKQGGIGYLTGPADFGDTTAVISKWTDRPKVLAHPGDVLVTVKGAGVGKSNLAPREKVAIGRQLMALRPIGGLVETTFLFLFIRTRMIEISGRALGATVPGLGRDALQSLSVPLPVISEQQHLVKLINRKMETVEKIRTSASEELSDIEALPAALLRQAFSGDL